MVCFQRWQNKAIVASLSAAFLAALRGLTFSEHVYHLRKLQVATAMAEKQLPTPLSMNKTTTATSPTAASHNDSLHGFDGQVDDPCSVAHWQQELSQEDPLLQDIQIQDVGFFHVTFSIQGNVHAEAEDRSANETTKTYNRTREMDTSVRCLKNALNKTVAPYQLFELGDYPSFHAGITAFHKWAANSSPHEANFVIDTDIVANPNSREISLEVIARELHNVDMTIAHNPYQQLFRPKLQDSIQTAIVGYRNNKRMRLFHTCVAHTMDQAFAEAVAAEEAEANKMSVSGEQTKQPPLPKKRLIRQQEAMAKVLQSPVGQFVRVRWYSPEFFCSDRKSPNLHDYMVWQKKGKVRDTPCLFIHSHGVARRHNLCT
jgi:hypothetical protein